MRTITILILAANIAALSSCAKKNANSYPINLPGNAKAYVAATIGDTAAYFINGKEYPLTSGQDTASANAIAVSGSDVYVAGYESNGARMVAKYWKNGVATALSDTQLNATDNAIAVVGSTVYVAGWVIFDGVKTAVLWENQNLTLL